VRLLGVRVAGLAAAEAQLGGPDRSAGALSPSARPDAPDQLELSF
jgi:hypothetical protein